MFNVLEINFSATSELCSMALFRLNTFNMKNFCLTKGLDKIEKIYGKNILENTLFLLLKNRKTANLMLFISLQVQLPIFHQV